MMRYTLALTALAALAACSGEVTEPTPSGEPMHKEVTLDCNVHGDVAAIYGEDQVSLKVAGRNLTLKRMPSAVAGAKYSDDDNTLWENQGEFLLELQGQEADMCKLAED